MSTRFTLNAEASLQQDVRKRETEGRPMVDPLHFESA